MAQTTTLTAGTSDATSTDIAVAPGASVIVGIFLPIRPRSCRSMPGSRFFRPRPESITSSAS